MPQPSGEMPPVVQSGSIEQTIPTAKDGAQNPYGPTVNWSSAAERTLEETERIKEDAEGPVCDFIKAYVNKQVGDGLSVSGAFRDFF